MRACRAIFRSVTGEGEDGHGERFGAFSIFGAVRARPPSPSSHVMHLLLRYSPCASA